MKFIYQIFLIIVTGFVLLSCRTQSRINTDLKKEMDAIMFTDQAFRRQYDSEMSRKKEEILQIVFIWIMTPCEKIF